MVTTDADDFSREHGIGGFVVGSQIDAIVKGFLLGKQVGAPAEGAGDIAMTKRMSGMQSVACPLWLFVGEWLISG